MNSSIDGGKSEAVGALLGAVSKWGLGITGATAIGVASLGALNLTVVVAAIVFAGIVLGSLAISLRYYTVLWWLWLPVLFIPVIAFLEHLRAGAISFGSVLFGYSLALAIVFGALLAAGDRFRKLVG
jgi:hypothetical protein